MKKTRLLALALALLLAFSLTACGEKETRKPIEILKASVSKQPDVKSAHNVVKGALSFDVPEALLTPDQKMIADALKDASLEFESIIDTEAGKGHLKAELKAAGGVSFSGEAFILSENEMLLSTPLVPQQIIVSLEDLKQIYEKETNQQFPAISFTNPGIQEDFKPMMDAALDFVGDVIKDEKPAIASEEVEFSTGKEKVTTVTYTYKNDEVLEAMFRMLENAINSPNFIKYLEQVMEMDKKMGIENPMDLENIKAELETAKTELPKNKEQVKNMITAYLKFKNMEFSFAVDKNDFMRKSAFKLELEFTNPFDTTQVIPVKLDVVSLIDQCNAVKAEDIPTATVDSANSVKLQDFIKQNVQ